MVFLAKVVKKGSIANSQFPESALNDSIYLKPIVHESFCPAAYMMKNQSEPSESGCKASESQQSN